MEPKDSTSPSAPRISSLPEPPRFGRHHSIIDAEGGVSKTALVPIPASNPIPLNTTGGLIRPTFPPVHPGDSKTAIPSTGFSLRSALVLLSEFAGYGMYARNAKNLSGGVYYTRPKGNPHQVITLTPLGYDHELFTRIDAEVGGRVRASQGWLHFEFGGKGMLDVLPGDPTVQKVFMRPLAYAARWDFTILQNGSGISFILKELQVEEVKA